MELIRLQGEEIQAHTCVTVVVGSGAAGLQAAGELRRAGARDVLLVTEDMKAGTSRNTGSDKQTYYKLTLSGGAPDSVRAMAQTLFDGQAVDGEIALCEAALTVPCFFNLVSLGVPFPSNAYGEYVGYRTDHDPRSRATSVGPYTSRVMTECLEKRVRSSGVPILDHTLVIAVLSDGQAVRGLLCLNCDGNAPARFTAINCAHVVFATGGPAGMYANSVYPGSQFGATGTAFAAGVAGQNLTEWQFGLASVQPRWNVSGTYMQALPRFVSTNGDGGDEREFLSDFFPDRGDLLTKVFLKGYQWPFDVNKVKDGSSVIDILVDMERRKGRRVFLDYGRNPGGREPDFAALAPEARDYLRKTDACFGTPYERLTRMNAPAAAFYREHGVDLSSQMLEIALCVQHNNGGLAIDDHWQTSLRGFYVVGEAAASHGVYRPGGSALNAGQVGATRAAGISSKAVRCPTPVLLRRSWPAPLTTLWRSKPTRRRPAKPT
jgi:succinate dehydrogenase/fumarate reductase flavoprotein subunit